ncbi:MAG TPA: hypothetical protein VIJ38_00810 [Acidobacteriaceae bacterium]
MAMTNAISELDRMQSSYQAASEEWIAAIRREEALASAAVHSETEIDLWEGACFAEEDPRAKAKSAKKAYEDVLRLEFFNF